ncbi:MAG: DUF3307 domain-containing protein [Anaerolineales bacterium]|nr:DUF3307 domain-containing protein [Anaerolineales bacterium]
MVLAMFLAHLVGDYILQWDSLAAWKSRQLSGVLAHVSVVFLVTWLFSLPFDPTWWRGVVFIGLTHLFIDAVQLYVKPPIPALLRFTLDQAAHVTVILLALAAGGFLEINHLAASFSGLAHSQRLMTILLSYAFITMPAWVIVKFTAYGLVHGRSPEFPGRTNKYLEILERILMTTFVAFGQFLLIPLVVVPRLVSEWPDVAASKQTTLYLVEMLASITLAVGVGLLLRQL